MSIEEQMIKSLADTAQTWTDYYQETQDRTAGMVSVVLLALAGFIKHPDADPSALLGLVDGAGRMSEELLAQHREIPS